MADRLQGLESVAKQVPTERMGDTAGLQRYLEQRPFFLSQFNAGAYIADINGTAIASIPVSVGRVGANYMYRDHVASALKAGKTKISQPAIGLKLNVALFAMATPIRNARGHVVGVLVGVINLKEPNFLDKFTESRYGKSGYFLIVDPLSRHIVTGTDRQRMMQSFTSDGINSLIDCHDRNCTQTAITRNSQGVTVLASATHIPVANWFLVAELPTAEAFVSLSHFHLFLFSATSLIALFAGGLLWYLLRGMLMPMTLAAQSLKLQSGTMQPNQTLRVTRDDEVGQLISAFNQVLATLKDQEVSLRESEAKLSAILNEMKIHMWAFDGTSYLFTNKQWFDFTGQDSNVPLTFERWIEAVHPDDVAKASDVWMRNLANKTEHDNYFRLRRHDGVYRDFYCHAMPNFDEEGRFKYFLGFNLDITERNQMEQQIRQFAFYDTLTNLPNRRLLTERLNQTIVACRRSGRYSALLFLDLDNFKPLNDMHGHEMGDLLLIEASARLKSCVREMDTVARFGGDEFIVMLGDLDTDKTESAKEADLIAEKIRKALSEPYLLISPANGHPSRVIEHHCTASIGVTLFNDHDASQNEIFKRADTAMYQAKEAGRNQICFSEMAV